MPGAGNRDRTDDLLITNYLPFHLFSGFFRDQLEWIPLLDATFFKQSSITSNHLLMKGSGSFRYALFMDRFPHLGAFR
jgi:hypothetical protein